MKRIVIINGTYGYRPAGVKFVEPKQVGDAPFEVEDKEAKRLVGLNVARYVTEAKTPEKSEDLNDASPDGDGEITDGTGVATPAGDENGSGADVDSIEDVGEEVDGEEDGEEDEESDQEKPEYSTETSFDDLKALLADCGISFKVGMSRASIIAALDEFYDSDDGDDDSLPDLTAETPEI